ncbi:hypothetical protein P7C71_g1938, partial [Lecanoromycetidae sp. Uapishka_2]
MMDGVEETPTKRRKLDDGRAAYDSQNDSGDEIFDDFETVATLPVHLGTQHWPEVIDPPSSPLPYLTQPTQIIRKTTPSSNGRQTPSVQVAASSPSREPNAASPTPSRMLAGGRLASSMAPAGTAFRAPPGVAKAPQVPPKKVPPVHDISDDDLPTYKGSSDEEWHKADIKPSTFVTNAQKPLGSVDPHNGGQRFREITTNSVYKPSEASNKPTLSGSAFDSGSRNKTQTTSRFSTSGDVLANAYGGKRKPQPHKQQAKQAGPSKARPDEQDLDIDDIEDFQLRSKIKRMREILPDQTVLTCKRAMELRKFNFDDAMELLASSEGDPTQIDLTISDGEDVLASQAPKRAPAKQQIKAPIKSIQEKWAAIPTTQKVALPSSPLAISSSPVTAPKQRRRLVQGRKQHSPDVISSPAEQEASAATSKHANLDVDDTDSDSALGASESDDAALESKVLDFFNTCSTPDLADITSISDEIASVILSKKPFKSLSQVREVSDEAPPKNPKTKRKPAKKPIGDRVVDKCMDMWTGYEAVDQLVKQCEDLGKPLKEDMKAWGVDVYGAELDLVSFDRDTSPKDSAIGTPSTSLSEDEGDVKVHRRRTLFTQPSIMASNVELKDYQVVGVNWLSLLFDRKLSCILADDMGLGKTCQVIAFLAHLLEKGIKGPHLVVVPASTLENWLREFSIFCPQLQVMPYYASQSERPGVQAQILDSLDTLNVIVTTYTLARTKDDNRFFRKLRPTTCIYDEGHYLKNSKSALYGALMRIPTQFRLLLTGTPLQNNLQELASLLGFILPSVFREHSEDLEHIFNNKAKTTDSNPGALLSNQRIARAKSMMTPFIMRRKKHQVLRHLPAKTRRVEYCDLSPAQLELYQKEKSKALRVIEARAAGEKVGNQTANVMMALRKASIHPLLFRRLYDDDVIRKMSRACVKEEPYRESNPTIVYEDMEVMTDMELNRFCTHNPKTMTQFLLEGQPWMDSGKVSKLAELLLKFKSNGDRILVFSQFVMVLDILEAVLEQLEMTFFRLDGNTKTDERQDMIDQFYREPEITVFLLSTGAGGTGINLACANKVIVFDSSFNPQSDIQAENRAHRVGQTREVEVVRLVTKNTIEEQIHALGETKLALDDRVAGVVEDDAEGRKAEKQGAKLMEEMMIEKLEEELKGGSK